MTRTILPLWVLLGSVGMSFGDEPKAATKYKEFAEILDDLKSRDGALRAAAVRRLQAFGELGLALIRRELRKAEFGQHWKVLNTRLADLRAERWKSMPDRAADWATAGRWDCMNELLSTSPGRDPAALLDAIVKERGRLSVAFDQCLTTVADPMRIPLNASVEYPPNLLWLAERRSSDDPITEKEGIATDSLDDWLIRAEVCRFKYKSRRSCFFSVRARLTDLLPLNDYSEWQMSTLFINSAFAAREISHCLVICDGDFTLNGRTHELSRSLIICNGDFIADEVVSPHRVGGGVIYATGDIRFPNKNKKPSNSVFFAGGKVHDAKGVADAKRIHEGVTDTPFNVRFLDPKEFGLTLEAAKGGLAVAKQDEKSPFAEQGLRAGDLITHADDLPMKTGADFRRELRRGVIDGGLVVHVSRDGKTIPMLFAVPDVPKPPKK